MSNSYCYWSVADGLHADMIVSTVDSARKHGVTEDFHIWSDKEIPNAFTYDCAHFDKSHYLFKYMFLREKVSQLNYDYFVFIDADSVFVRNPGNILDQLKGDPIHVCMESDCTSPLNVRPDWWGCPLEEYVKLMKERGVRTNSVFNTNAGLWIVKKGIINRFCDLSMEFWDHCHKKGYTFTEEAPLAYVGHMLMGDPYKHRLIENKNVWASDWVGYYSKKLPDGQPFEFTDYMSGRKYEVNPSIVHCMQSKKLLINEGRIIRKKTKMQKENSYYVVTASDSQGFEKMMVSFLASLKERARWKGNIIVIDLGLSSKQKHILEKLGIEVIKSIKLTDSSNFMCDRYEAISEFAKNRKGIYAHWDADIWFNHPIDEIFETAEQSDKLLCTLDCVRQSFVHGVVPNEELRKKVEDVLNKFASNQKDKLLQGGFICGNSKHWANFASLQKMIIGTGFSCDQFGVDSLALNLFGNYFPQSVKVVDIIYNCTPDWQPIWNGENFIYEDRIIKCLHVTSPYRKKQELLFQEKYPNEYKKWSQILEIEITPEDKDYQAKGYEDAFINNMKYKVRDGKYWDQSIVSYTHEQYKLDDKWKIPKDSVIIDIGAHIGGFTKRVAEMFPNTEIYAFEPEENNFKLLEINMKGYKNVHLFNAAVVGYGGKYRIEILDHFNTGMHRVFKTTKKENIIKTYTINKVFSDIIKNKNVFLLKMDCEGGEWSIFRAMSKKNSIKINNIQAELHLDLCYLNDKDKNVEAIDITKMRVIMKDLLPTHRIKYQHNFIIGELKG